MCTSTLISSYAPDMITSCQDTDLQEFYWRTVGPRSNNQSPAIGAGQTVLDPHRVVSYLQMQMQRHKYLLDAGRLSNIFAKCMVS